MGKNNTNPGNTNELGLETNSSKPAEKKIIVKILGLVRGSYGAYDENDIVLLEEKYAKALIKSGNAVETKEKTTETKPEEDK